MKTDSKRSLIHSTLFFVAMFLVAFQGKALSQTAPDLVVSGGVGVSPNPVSPGNSVTVSYTVYNQGNGNAAQSTTKIQIKDGSGTLLTQQYFTVPSIGAGSSSPQSSSMSIPSTAVSGTYTVYVVLDYNNAIGQSNINNDIYYTSFSIQIPQNYISVTSPPSGANWGVGTQQQVIWSSKGTISTVNVKLSADGGASYSYVLGLNIANTGAATVTVPNISSSMCRIKVESSTDQTLYGISQGNFSISTQQTEQASVVYETYPTGTTIQPQESFTMSWVLKNTGTTTWKTTYGLQYVSGTLSTNHNEIPCLVNVSPGQSYSFFLPMVAPQMIGSYQEQWKFVNGAGQIIPVNSSQTLLTSINVVGSISDSLVITNLTTNDTALDWGQSTVFVATVQDRGGNPIVGAMLVGQDEISGRQYQAGPTEANGLVAYQTGVVSSGVPDGTSFHVTFRATKVGFVDSPIQISQVKVNHQPQTQSPSIALSQPTSLSFSAPQNGQLPNTRNITITNGGQGTLSWSISNIASWLSVTPAVGVSNSTVVVIQPSSTALSSDGSPYVDTLQVMSAKASNSPQYIVVQYTISGGVGNQYTVGQVTIAANSITDNPNGSKLASGNVTINNILGFSGPLTIRPSDNTVSGDCDIYVGKTTIYSGSFTFRIPTSNPKLTDFSPLLPRLQLKVGGFSVGMNDITFLADGILIDGYIDFSLPFGIKINVDALQITRSAGIQIAGSISVDHIGLTNGVELKNVTITYDGVNDSFSGTATVSTEALTVSGGLGFVHGKLDFVELHAQSSTGYLLDGSGFSVYGLGGGVHGLASPPVSFDIYGDLSTSDPVISKIVMLTNLGLTYTVPTSLEGHAQLTLFGKYAAANVNLSINIPTNVELGADVDLGGIIVGSSKLGIALGQNVALYGNISGTLQVPDGDWAGSDIVRAVHPLPWPLSSIAASLQNYEATVKASLGPLSTAISVDFAPVLQGGTPKFDLSNFVNFNLFLFGNAIKPNHRLNNMNRFEGLSLRISRESPNKYMSVSSAQNLTQAVPITSEYNQLVFRLTGSRTIPQTVLVRPDGQTFHPNDLVRNNQFGITYAESDSMHKAFWIIDSPIKGNWQIEITDTTNPMLDVIASMLPLGVSMVEPSTDQTSGNIEWVDSGSPDSATVSLYYSKNNFGLNGALIVDGLHPANGLNSYTWDFSNVPPGAYYVYAVIEDGHNASRYCYSAGRIIVPSVVQAPFNLKVQFNDPTVTLTWTSPANTPVTGFFIEYTDVNEPSYRVDLSVGDTNQCVVGSIVPGRTYTFSIAAIDTSSKVSSPVMSGPINCISKVSDNHPAFRFDSRLPFKIQVWKPLSLRIPAFDADGDQLLYSLLSAPSGLTVDAATGQLSWTPTEQQLGFSNVQLRVSDGKGGVDSLTVQFNVIRPENPTISFTRTYYNSNTPVGIITVHDDAVDLNSIQVQQVIASLLTSISSKTVTCRETAPNSGFFTGVFDMSSSVLVPGDTLQATYTSSSGQVASSIAYWSTATPVVEEHPIVPDRYELFQNYPNPFNPTTTIKYSLHSSARVTLVIYDVLGQKVTTLVDGIQRAGYYTVTWNGMNQQGISVASGVYFCRLSVGEFTAVKKLMLLR